MKKILSTVIIIFIGLVFIVACSKTGEKQSKSMLPPASGRPGEMIVVMDSAQWYGSLGETVRNTFEAEVGGLPREENMFKLNRVDPGNLSRILKTVRNLLFVVSMDQTSADARRLQNYFTAESIQKIKSDPNLFVSTTSDQFANGQNVMYLFGQTEGQLINKIRGNKQRLQNYFNHAEYARLRQKIFKGTKTTGLSKTLEEDHQCSMLFPFNYKLVMSEPGFIWFRQINDDNDKSIFITYRDYRNESMFEKENLIQLRDSIAKEFIYGDPEKPESYVKTETKVPYIPITTNVETFNGNYAVKMAGLWKTNNISMGGPFIGYAMVDKALNRFYYIEGFIYSPGKKQREYMREMDVVLHTFKMSKPEKASDDKPAAK